MCVVEENLECENKLQSFYKRNMDDTLALVCDHSDATDLLSTLNEAHPSLTQGKRYAEMCSRCFALRCMLLIFPRPRKCDTILVK